MLIVLSYGENQDLENSLAFLVKHQITEPCVVVRAKHASPNVLRQVAHMDTDEGVLLLETDHFFERVQDSLLWTTDYPNHAAVWEFDTGSPGGAKGFDQLNRMEGQATGIEKLTQPTHGKVLTGLYYFPSDVFEHLSDSVVQMTDLLQKYLSEDRLLIHDVDGDWSFGKK